MNEPVEITEGVWVLHNPTLMLNTGILTAGGAAVVVDPPSAEADISVIRKGLAQQGLGLAGIVFTRRDSDASEGWSDSPLLGEPVISGTAPLSEHAPGWEIIPLGPSASGLYNASTRVLFCGQLLTATGAGELLPYISEGSRWYLDALAAVAELDPKVLVPAVGSLARGKRAIRKRIEDDRSYVYDVRRLVISSIMGEVTLDRVLQVTADLHEDFARLEEHLANIRGVWSELSASD
ncbi:MAG TPA: hypothetical protein VM409_05405 [Chloroflexia bacterium]|nr:hypothetical protein [Chloroflexia bacterium]